MAKVIQFPSQHKDPPIDHELDMARLIMHDMINTLVEYRYNPMLEEMQNDLGVIYTMVYAMMVRADGEYHQFHEMMEELAHELIGYNDDEYND